VRAWPERIDRVILGFTSTVMTVVIGQF
jgi:hypothetical protein